MKKYIQDIELINQFITNKLSKEEKIEVNNRLEIDDDFKLLFEEHHAFLKGMKRVSVKAEIINARQSYIKGKWLKYIGFSVLTIGVITLSYLLLADSTFVDNNFQSKIIIKDTLLKEKEQKFVETEVLQFEEKQIETSKKEAQILKQKPIITLPILSEIITSGTIEVKAEISDLKLLKKKPQIFVFNAEKDTTLICNEDTKLTIEANSFIDKNSRIVTGKVTLKVIEYYKLSDVLLADLSTTSDGKLLETGGMLFIEAEKDGKIIKLKEKTSIEVKFPYQKEKKNMQLFLGKKTEDFINWQLVDKENEELGVEDIVAEIPSEEFIEFTAKPIGISPSGKYISVIQKVPSYPGCEGNDSNASIKKCTSNKINKFISKNFNTNILEELNLPKQRISATFKIDKTGIVTDVYTTNLHPKLKAEVARVLKGLPRMTPGKQRGRAIEVEYLLPIVMGNDNNKRESVPLTMTPSSSVITARFPKSNRYILRTSKLGWISCDRFTRSSKRKTKYRFKIKDSKGVDIKLVFKEISAILPYKKLGEFYDFGTVPKGDKIKLIAIKTIDGKYFIDIIDTVIKIKPKIEFDFEKVTRKQLLEKLENLNNEF